jgi:hypothetical protein
MHIIPQSNQRDRGSPGPQIRRVQLLRKSTTRVKTGWRVLIAPGLKRDPLQSFTVTRPALAACFMRVPIGSPGPEDTWSWEWSPDQYFEDEVLLRGIRIGIEVIG